MEIARVREVRVNSVSPQTTSERAFYVVQVKCEAANAIDRCCVELRVADYAGLRDVLHGVVRGVFRQCSLPWRVDDVHVSDEQCKAASRFFFKEQPAVTSVRFALAANTPTMYFCDSANETVVTKTTTDAAAALSYIDAFCAFCDLHREVV